MWGQHQARAGFEFDAIMSLMQPTKISHTELEAAWDDSNLWGHFTAFDPLSPRLASLRMNKKQKLSVFDERIVNEFIVPVLLQGVEA